MSKYKKKIRIAITQDIRSLRCRLLVKLIQLCDAEPVLVPFMLRPTVNKNVYLVTEKDLKEHLAKVKNIISTCDALILPGNKYDVPPKAYGAKSVHKETKKRMPQKPLYARFETESLMFKYAIKQKWPILAICGGMHVANVLLGGSLVQHLPDDNRIDVDQVNHSDKLIKKLGHKTQLKWEESFEQYIATGLPKNIYQSTHNICVAPKSLLARIYKKTNRDIDLKHIGEISMHHQGCFNENLAKNLKPICWSEDGVVEAAELLDYNNMCLLVQFHLECDVSGLAKAVVQALIKAAKT